MLSTPRSKFLKCFTLKLQVEQQLQLHIEINLKRRKQEQRCAQNSELWCTIQVNRSEVRINEFQSNYLIKINFTLHLEGYQEEELSNAFEASWS